MKKDELSRLVKAAVFAALTCAATMMISIPIPATNGYVNTGDCVVLLGAFLLGPYYGAVAAAVGSSLADLLLSYASFAPGTFFIKGLMAVSAALIYGRLKARTKHSALIASLLAELWMVIGYFIYECTVLGAGIGALGGVPANLIQAVGGTLLASLLLRTLMAVPMIRRVQ
ncbi:MAG: ECF transporter S component [Oscillospiraceae bacterium]|nr:ECF transporter S component [Oscillospiraceae bacterium]